MGLEDNSYTDNDTAGGSDKQEETLDQQLKRLEVEKRFSIDRAKQLQAKHDLTWEEEINILAEIIEKQYVLLGQDWLVSSISEDITKIYRENGIRISENVNHLIHPRFKKGGSKHEDSSRKSQSDNDVLPEDLYIDNLRDIDRHVGLIDDKKLAEAYEINQHLAARLEKQAEERHVALLRGKGSGSSGSSQQEKVTTDKSSRPKGSLLYDEIGVTIKGYEDMRDRVFDFPAEILANDEEITEGLKTLNNLVFSSARDLKYSQNWLDWFKTESYRDIYGKHAAAVMSFSASNLCANCSDESTKNWVRMEPIFAKQYESYNCLQCGYQLDTVCPKCNLPMKLVDKPVISWQCNECEGTTPINRDLTREQVGDKSSIVMDKAIAVVEHIPFVMSFLSWYSDWIKPRVSGRKIRASNILSEKA